VALNKLLAGALSSAVLSAVWYLASPKDPPTTPADLALLRTPVTVTLRNGQQLTGDLHSADSLCADWTAALQAAPDTVVTLPDGRATTGADVQQVQVSRQGLAGLDAMGSASACPATLTVYETGSAGDTGDVQGSADDLSRALKDLTGP